MTKKFCFVFFNLRDDYVRTLWNFHDYLIVDQQLLSDDGWTAKFSRRGLSTLFKS